VEAPNITFNQLLKKNVGPNKYSNNINKKHNNGNKSKKKLKNKNSATKKIEPGNPKKTREFIKMSKKSFGHRKLIPLISVMRRVLNRRLTASTRRKEFVDNNA